MRRPEHLSPAAFSSQNFQIDTGGNSVQKDKRNMLRKRSNKNEIVMTLRGGWLSVLGCPQLSHHMSHQCI